MVNSFTESTCHLTVSCWEDARVPVRLYLATTSLQPVALASPGCRTPAWGVRARPQASSWHKPMPSSPWAVICSVLQSLQSRASLSPSTLEAMKFKCRFVFEITQGRAESSAAERCPSTAWIPDGWGQQGPLGTPGPAWHKQGHPEQGAWEHTQEACGDLQKGDYTSPCAAVPVLCHLHSREVP